MNNEDKENFSEDAILNAVNGVLEASAVDDDKIEDMTEAMIKVLSRQVQHNTAAKLHNVELEVLEMLVGAAKRRLLRQVNNAGSSSNSKKAVKQDVTAKKESKRKSKKTHQRGLEEQAEEEDEPLQEDKNSVDKTEEEGGGTEKSGKAHGRPKKDVVTGSKDSQQRGKKRVAKEMDDEDKGIASNKQLLALQIEPIGKRTRRSAQLDTESNASAQLDNNQNGEMASLKLALTLYKRETAATASDSSLAVQPYSLSPQQLPRRSIPSTNVAAKTTAAVVPLTSTGKKTVTWRDKTLGSQKMDLDETTQSLGSANKRLHNNPRWQQFPQVVEDVINIELARMYSRNEKEQAKCVNMKAGVLDIIRFGSSVKKASTEYRVGESTLTNYTHDVKVHLEKVLGMDVVTDEFLSRFNGVTTTYIQLRTALNRRNKKAIAVGKPPSVSNNSINKEASSSSNAQDADMKLMFLNKHSAPALLTSQDEYIEFTGTKKEYHALIKKILKRYAQNSQYGLQLDNLASLLANYSAAEYMVARRMERYAIPPTMLRGTLTLVSRCIRLVRFTDVDAKLDAEM